MIHNLQDTTRGTAKKIAEIICKTYPRTIANQIEGVEWGDGIATLRTSILNCVNYKSGSKKRKTTVSIADEDEDEDEIEVRIREKENLRNQDEYGCTQYAPELPADENCSIQEEKRLKLIEMFKDLNYDCAEVLELMEKTYVTQRKSINDVTRDIRLVMNEWPFLTNVECLLQHGSKLLGKSVITTWNDSLENKMKSIRQYLKTCQFLKKNKSNELKKLVTECKEAIEIRKDNLPNNVIIFPLLVLYFKENEEMLYKIVDVSFK